jgi:acyl-CoA reductase-like NAD-dependent aldehyde dehydrogenase
MSAPSRLETVFQGQRRAFAAEPDPDWRVRTARLDALEKLVRENVEAIAVAIREDFGNRSPHETRLLEVFPSLEQIRYARRHLRGWMRDERRAVSRWFLPGRARVIHQPLGVVGIIAPWNYPLLLAVSPLCAALAAGNRAMVKVSEFTPRTSALFAVLVARHFDATEVAVIEGDGSVGQAFAGLPFDHLLFTGSTRVGRSVMRAASANLTPVTLELGGKSPAIVGPHYPIARAAERIVLGKCLNGGQTCIAPDYVLLPAGREQAFIAAAQRTVDACYPELAVTPDYSSIVNRHHYARLVGYLDEVTESGGRWISLSASLAGPDARTRRIPPCAILGAPEETAVMREEIFGPLLPLVPYRDLDDAIGYVNAWPRPLALYYFDEDAKRIDRVLRGTVAGGVTVNDTILHIAQDDLPFGGVGPSGMGQYHAREGFEAFTKKKAVFYQSRVSGAALLKPPYRRRFESLLGMLLR